MDARSYKGHAEDELFGHSAVIHCKLYTLECMSTVYMASNAAYIFSHPPMECWRCSFDSLNVWMFFPSFLFFSLFFLFLPAFFPLCPLSLPLINSILAFLFRHCGVLEIPEKRASITRGYILMNLNKVKLLKLHSEILASLNNKNENLVPWIGKQLFIKMLFWQFSKINMYTYHGGWKNARTTCQSFVVVQSKMEMEARWETTW